MDRPNDGRDVSEKEWPQRFAKYHQSDRDYDSMPRGNDHLKDQVQALIKSAADKDGTISHLVQDAQRKQETIDQQHREIHELRAQIFLMVGQKSGGKIDEDREMNNSPMGNLPMGNEGSAAMSDEFQPDPETEEVEFDDSNTPTPRIYEDATGYFIKITTTTTVVGHVIGKGGSKKRQLEDKYGVTIIISENPTCIIISGHRENVLEAHQEIFVIVDKGSTNELVKQGVVKKKCWYPRDQCPHGDKCWYDHEDIPQYDEPLPRPLPLLANQNDNSHSHFQSSRSRGTDNQKRRWEGRRSPSPQLRDRERFRNHGISPSRRQPNHREWNDGQMPRRGDHQRGRSRSPQWNNQDRHRDVFHDSKHRASRYRPRDDEHAPAERSKELLNNVMTLMKKF